jgi:hypothetical protein
VGKKPSAQKLATNLAEIQKIPVCEDCEVLRGANLYAAKYYGSKEAALFENNLLQIMTTHVDLGCKVCPVDDIMKMLRKDRSTAIAAMY